MVEFLSAIILPKNLSRAPPLLLTHGAHIGTAGLARSSSTSCTRRWTMTSTCRNGQRAAGQRRAPNICSADLVRGSRRYCGTACARACVYVSMCVYAVRAHNLAPPILQYTGCTRKRSSRDFNISQFAAKQGSASDAALGYTVIAVVIRGEGSRKKINKMAKLRVHHSCLRSR